MYIAACINVYMYVCTVISGQATEADKTNPALLDPSLTFKGRRQAGASGAAILSANKFPELVIVSPMKRTCETAACALAMGALASIPVVAIEGCRERTGEHIYDGRKPVSDTAKQFPRFDFSQIDTGPDTRHDPHVRETIDQLVERGRGFFWELQHREEKIIAVFSHSSFLRNVLEHGMSRDDPQAVTHFANGEHRVMLLTFTE